MVGHDPEQVIFEEVQAMYVSLGDTFFNTSISSVHEQTDRALQNENNDVDQLKIYFLQNRNLPDRQVYFVLTENSKGQKKYWLCGVLRDAQNYWSCVGIAEISIRESKIIPRREIVPGVALKEVVHEKKVPGVSLAFIRNDEGFWAGGPVFGNGFDVVRVRLILKSGITVEDSVQDNVVLFVADQKMSKPVQIELCDRSESIVGTQTIV